MKRNLNRTRVYLTTLAFALGCGAASAQTADPQQAPAAHDGMSMHGGHHEHNPHKQAERLSQKLNLTPDQTSKIEPILANRDQQMEALHGNTQLAPADRHAQMRTIDEQAKQAMAGILSPDQMAQLKEMHHHHMHHDQAGGDSPSPTA